MKIRTTWLAVLALAPPARVVANPETHTSPEISQLRFELQQCKAKVAEMTKQEDTKKALKEGVKKKMATVEDCSAHQSCDVCLAEGCGWCIGERACVPDEPWMCQGEEDHIGKIGMKKECPTVVDEEDVAEEVVDEVKQEVRLAAEDTFVGTGDGVCRMDSSGCVGQKICHCDREEEERQCTCGRPENMNGCCNCGCGMCEEMCRDPAAHTATLENERKGDDASDIHRLTREELLRVKVEMEVGADGEMKGREGGEFTENEISKCAIVKQRVEIDGTEDPYMALNVTDSATTAEIRRSYRKLSVLLHPDKHPQALCGDEALIAFTSLVAAHELLSDPDRRAAFDMYGDDLDSFNTQWEYEASGRRNTKDFYRNSKHITNINTKLWDKLKATPAKKGEKVKIWIVEFYAPWCGGCQRFTDTFKKMAEKIAEHEPDENDDWYGVDLEVGAVNCESYMPICQNEFNIRRYPTVRLVSPSFGTQHELQANQPEPQIREDAFEVAAEWLWLFDRAKVEKIKGKDEFEEKVVNSEEFHIVLFLDGETCAPCRSAKTNALRLSAGLLSGGGGGVVSFVNCATTEMRKFCVDDVGIPQAPHAPQVLGWGAGNKTEGFSGEVLYNANEVPPHAALKLIESIVRMSGKVEEGEEGIVGGGGGRKGGYDEGAEEDEVDEGGGGGWGGRRRGGEFKGPKLHWNGPSGRVAMSGGGGGGGGGNLIGR
ncbi:hypothetical protein TrCOL_g9998 [Triparma columacea]|uniref:DnaJ homolog subfamily C member 16 n=1 Tax=Triparma columacea TaxID=722753 RepID=A0A9W7LAE4_9STRA|nr:hypothetical protein TrCOL_g9998 [Triparma columacea]